MISTAVGKMIALHRAALDGRRLAMRNLTPSGKKKEAMGRFHNGYQAYGDLAGDKEMCEKKACANLTHE